MTETLVGIATVVIGVISLYLAHNLNRQFQAKVAEKRLDAYRQLWALLEVAGPWRLETKFITTRPATSDVLRGPISSHERLRLYDGMTRWYFESGQGMLLGAAARELYLNAKFNLVCEVDGDLRLNLTASQIEKRLETVADRDSWRGRLSMRQLSLLRAQMRNDLRIFGNIYQRGLGPWDKAFLTYAGVNLKCKPWRLSKGPIARVLGRNPERVAKESVFEDVS